VKFDDLEFVKEEDVDIQIERVDSYADQTRSMVQTPDRAARVTHIPSGIQIRCQEHRSAAANCREALSGLDAMLKARWLLSE